jgi:putative AbiEii toxin of type IV toxin-antitoxin system
MTASEQNVVGAADAQPWDLSFSAVEVGGSAALGADVRLDLAPRMTVLVGKNGAGKSLLLEKLQAGIFAAFGAPRELDPARFACEVDVRTANVQDAEKLRYECRFRLRDATAPDGHTAGLEGLENSEIGGEVDIKVEETCRITDPREELLWRVDDGLVTYNTGEHAEIAAGRTLVNWTINRRRRGEFVFPNMAYPLRELFSGVIRVPAGVPRGDGEREELALPYPEVYRERARMGPSRRIRRLAYNLIRWHEGDRGRFDELVQLGRRTGLLEEIKVKLYRDPEAGPGAHRRDLASVVVDGTDLGLLSDGTLRVAEILVWLLFPRLKLLLVEEPETAVHPGLLSRLLAEFDAYASDRQIVLSTQSPQVVSWADPLAIRLVERRSMRTEVRRLHENEFGRLSSYLHDEGTLGDFVYSGALDG